MSQNPAILAAAPCPRCKAGLKQPCRYRTGDHDRVGTVTKACHPERIEALGDAACGVCGGRLAAHNRTCQPFDETTAPWIRSPAFRACVRDVVEETLRDWPVLTPRAITNVLPTEAELRAAPPMSCASCANPSMPYGTCHACGRKWGMCAEAAAPVPVAVRVEPEGVTPLTVGELRAALSGWSDDAEVWGLQGFTMAPALRTRTFGPDSTGRRDGLAIELHTLGKPSPDAEAEKVADDLFDALLHHSNIDWRFENDAGLLQCTVYAEQVIRWCRAMGWPIPEGTPGLETE